MVELLGVRRNGGVEEVEPGDTPACAAGFDPYHVVKAVFGEDFDELLGVITAGVDVTATRAEFGDLAEDVFLQRGFAVASRAETGEMTEHRALFDTHVTTAPGADTQPDRRVGVGATVGEHLPCS